MVASQCNAVSRCLLFLPTLSLPIKVCLLNSLVQRPIASGYALKGRIACIKVPDNISLFELLGIMENQQLSLFLVLGWM
jgi:hypothetical protein